MLSASGQAPALCPFAPDVLAEGCHDRAVAVGAGGSAAASHLLSEAAAAHCPTPSLGFLEPSGGPGQAQAGRQGDQGPPQVFT